MPKGCKLFNPEIQNRDLLMCNPSNTGHYQYPKFEDFSYDTGCHEREVIKFLKNPDPVKYVVFYTRRTDFKGNGKNKIVGFFKVGITNRTKTKLIASRKILLKKQHQPTIDYTSRGVPVSWGNSGIKDFLNDKLNELINSNDMDASPDYQNETIGIMNHLKLSSGRKRIIEFCENCSEKSKCYWGCVKKQYKIKRLNKLYKGNQIC